MLPFFDSMTIRPVFQSPGIYSASHIPSKIPFKVLTTISPPPFTISALIPSVPGAFPDFMELTAIFTSTADGGSVLFIMSSTLTGMADRLVGASLVWVCSATPMRAFPYTAFTGTSLFPKPLASVLVILYNAAKL